MIRLAVRCDPEHADRVLAELLELVPDGVEEERGETFVEFAIYGPPGELPELPDLRAAAGASLVEIETTEIPDDWADGWKDFHRPIVVGDRLVVRPSWIEREPTAPPLDLMQMRLSRTGREAEDSAIVEVVIDPGMAFGTGAHQTTRLCLELLVELADRESADGGLADWGTGSGVLAITAAKLGFSPVIACDSELASIAAAGDNAELNGVELELQRVNLREHPAPEAPTVVANLTAPILRAVAERLGMPPRTLICSGLLHAEADGIAEAFSAHGLLERERRDGGDWAALLLSRG